MTERRAPGAGARRRWFRYAGVAAGLTAIVVAGGWPWLDPAARRGLVLAAGIALPLQLALFAGLVTRRTGSPGFLGMWLAGTLIRLLALGGAAVVVTGREGVDPLTALVGLAGLLFALLLLETWALRDVDNGPTTNG